MNETLINEYIQNLRKPRKENLIDIMKYVHPKIENAVVSSIFTLPGFTVDFLPVCNFNVKKDKVIIRFFQKDVFDVFKEKMSDIEHGRCSIAVNDKADLNKKYIDDLFKLMTSSAKVDAAFIRAVQMRDYGYYNHSILSPRKNAVK